MEIKPEDLPNECFEDQGVKFKDYPHAIFFKNGKLAVVLCARRAADEYPIAIMSDRSAWIVVEGSIKGIFKKEVHLILQDKTKRPLALNIPIKDLAKEFQESLPRFLEWVKICSEINKIVPQPNWVFCRGLRLPDEN